MGLRCRRCRKMFLHLVILPYVQCEKHELDSNILCQLELTSRLPNSNHSLLSLKMHQSDATFRLSHYIYLHKQ